MKSHQIGDKVWFAFAGQELITETCPVCFGQKTVTLILGNGDQVTTPCDYCGRVYEDPQGVIQEWKYRAEARQVEVTDIEIKASASGEIREYTSRTTQHYYRLEPQNTFDTEAEAQARAAVLVEEHAMLDVHTRRAQKEYNIKSYAWHVGYHLREAKEAARKFEYHNARAIVCKVKAKTSIL